MSEIGTNEVKTCLPALLERVERGERFTRSKADPALAAILVSALFLNGCHTTTRVALPDAAPTPAAISFSELRAGDNVRVTLKSGGKVSFVLSEVRADALVGESGQAIALGDIADVRKQTFSGARTTWLIIGVAGGLAFLVVAAMAAATASLLSGP